MPRGRGDRAGASTVVTAESWLLRGRSQSGAGRAQQGGEHLQLQQLAQGGMSFGEISRMISGYFERLRGMSLLGCAGYRAGGLEGEMGEGGGWGGCAQYRAAASLRCNAGTCADVHEQICLFMLQCATCLCLSSPAAAAAALARVLAGTERVN
jgi:hypothetical protein